MKLAFAQARENDVVLFFDEADSLLSKRAATGESCSTRINRNRAVFMQEFDRHPGVVIKIHQVAANAQCALTFALPAGQAGDAPTGRALLQAWESPPTSCHLIMDRAYEGDETRQLALDLRFIPVVPPKIIRISPRP